MINNKLISVIIPAYNAERFIDKCVGSIVAQSYSDLEIIIVNDGSTDNTHALIANYAKMDNRINVITHPHNMGLFQARITGFEASHGDYIAFVDADDSISIDWFRLLIQQALKEQSDITIGQFFFQYSYQENKYTYKYWNMDPLRQSILLEGQDVFDAYMRQQGTYYSWQLVWNKLYTRQLWNSALDEFKNFSQNNARFIMCEDMIFSTALWHKATKVSNITSGAEYYYAQHEDNFTSISSSNNKKLNNLQDCAKAFTFMQSYIDKNNLSQLYNDSLYKWKLVYAKIYYKLLSQCMSSAKLGSLIKDLLCINANDNLGDKTSTDSHYYHVLSECNNTIDILSEAKQQICSNTIKVVSMDIFDTLILRPFLDPVDLFSLMNDEFCNVMNIKSYVDFEQIRVNAEYNCRQRIFREHKGYEDITLSEIYDQIALDYMYDRQLLQQIEQLEANLEVKYCTVRNTGKQLYELALQQGKKVILASDMYLPKEVIQQILIKNGYTEHHELYLSSDIRLTKASTKLYKYITKQHHMKPKSFIHIGDNWHADIINSKYIGWNALYLAKPADMLKNSSMMPYSGEAYVNIIKCDGKLTDQNNAIFKFSGYRCALAIVANKIFDNPFNTTAEGSDFDCDPYRIGYHALGNYLFSVTHWITKKVKSNNYNKVHFVSRDGYLPMLAYNIMQQHDQTLPDSNYLYLSRKAFAVADIYSPQDIYSLYSKMNVFLYSPQKFCDMFSPYLHQGAIDKLTQWYGNPAVFSKQFTCTEDYQHFIKHLAPLIDFDKMQAQKNQLKSYLMTMLSKNDVLWDIGYSGRCEAVLANLLPYPVNSMYIHSNSQLLDIRKSNGGFDTDCFYDYKPYITGVIREHAFMKLGPSVIGYSDKNGMLEPIFEKYEEDVTTAMMTNIMQRGALDYVKDMMNIFGDCLDKLYYRHTDLAYTFEYYLHYSKALDRKVFDAMNFEDDFGMGDLNALECWEGELYNGSLGSLNEKKARTDFTSLTKTEKLILALNGQPVWKKGLAYLLLDHKHFRKQFKRKLKGKKDKE